MSKNTIRFDPLYRIIDETDEMRAIEGKYFKLFNRLKNINNLGIITKVLEGAKHSKYEHHSGTLFQINSLIERDYIPEKYHQSLIISSLFLHLGHFPYTYSTEKAALIAANLDKTVKKHIELRLDKVFEKSDINNGDKLKSDLFSLRKYKLFYKYNSAYLFLDNWNELKSNFSLKDEQQKTILRNIYDESFDGYRYIDFADKADYVQRDALYFGSVRLDLSPKHLYRDDPLIGDNNYIDEWALIRVNLMYLQEYYYQAVDVRCFSLIFEKIVAKLIVSNNFDMNWLYHYNDDEFLTLITKNRKKNNKPSKISISLKKRADQLLSKQINFKLIFHITNTYYLESTTMELEYKILGINGKAILDYPFKRGILLDVGYEDKQRCSLLSKSHSGYNQFSIGVFQDDGNRSAVELMKCMQKISKNCSAITHVKNIRDGIGKQISWTNNCRIDNGSVIKAIAEIIMSMDQNCDGIQSPKSIHFLQQLQRIKSFSDIWNNTENYYLLKDIELTIGRNHECSDDDSKLEVYEILVKMILGLPTKLLQYKHTQEFVEAIITAIKDVGPSKQEGVKGNLFEALFLLDRIINYDGEYHFLINGLVVVDPKKPKHKRDVNEFDVIDFYLDENGGANCWIYACSTSENYKVDNSAQLQKIASHIRSLYSDVTIRTRYVIPSSRDDWNFLIKQADFNSDAE